MAAFQLLLQSPLLHPHLQHSLSSSPNSQPQFRISTTWFIPKPKLHKTKPPKSSINGDINNSPEKPPKLTRQGRKKSPIPSSSSTTTTKRKHSRKTQIQNGSIEATNPKEPQKYLENLIVDEDDYDDGIDFPYEDPPLICCFGAVQKEFVPTVRVSEEQMHPDMYSHWKMLQWNPPEFVRALGGPPSNVTISHMRLGGRAAFMGEVRDDQFGEEFVLMMNKEKVQTRAVKLDRNVKTGCAYMKIKFDDGKNEGGDG